LLQYINLPHELLLKDGIDIKTQKEWEIMYSLKDDRIIFPIRDEIGSLVGVKARATNNEEENKYIYHYPVSKSKMLFGLYKTLPYIKEKNEAIVFEAEKSTIKSWGYGYKNSVAIGGKTISEAQAMLLAKLQVPIVLAFDKDCTKEDIKKSANMLRKYFVEIYIIYDKKNILDEKESPVDNLTKWRYLYKNHKYKIGGV